jgi:glycosyltransferase involved in cell wall biosynthesis
VRVSFIIPALNERQHLPTCLRSIFALDKPGTVTDIEVHVVDTGSLDGTPQIAREHGARVVVAEPGRVGRTRNVGARASHGELLAFIDADCELSTNWLARCAGHFQDSDVVAVGTTMPSPEDSAPWVEVCWYAIAHRPRDIEVERVDWLPSFNLLVRRDAFMKVGGFDETLVTCEDSDLGYKLSSFGKLLRDHVVPTRHYGESKSLREFFRREAWRSRGSAQSLFSHKLKLGELPSVLVPPAFVAAWIAGLVLVALAARWPWLAWAGAGLIVAAAMLPVAALLKKRVSPVNAGLFVRCWTLLSVYFCARAVGLVMPIRRLSR